MAIEPNVAETIVESLCEWGCEVVFGVAGDAILDLLDAIARDGRSRLRFVDVHHEEAAALAASAYAKLSGRVGVCIATAGPGTAHLVNGLADAYTDGAPVVAITGQVPTQGIGTHHKQYIDQNALLAAVSRFSTMLVNPSTTGTLLERALRTAAYDRTVTHLAIPKDLWHQWAGRPAAAAPYLHTPARSSADVWAEAAERWAAAERPVILAGTGAKHATGELFALAEASGAGVIHTLGLAGKIPAEHPLSLGGIGDGGSEAATEALLDADLLLRVGANWWPAPWVPERLASIDVDASPMHVGSGLYETYGVVGDAREVLVYLQARDRGVRSEWREALSRAAGRWRERLAAEVGGGAGGVHPAGVVAALAQAAPADAVITLDVGEHVLWFNRHFCGRGQDVVFSGNWRTMGFGIPAALAASCVDAARPVAALVGDGGLSMQLAELATAAKHRMPIVVVVVNNGQLALEAHEMQLRELWKVGVDLKNPDFAAVARACGGVGQSIKAYEDVLPALRDAFARDQFTLLDVQVSAPMLPSLPESTRRQIGARTHAERPAGVSALSRLG